MAEISLRGIRRVHPDGTAALDGVDLTVGAHEMLGVIGPSGSGKSTLLRVVAGLEPATAGEVRIGDRSVTGLRTRDRNVALVAQQRTLYTFLTVAEQLAFPLELRRLSQEEIEDRTAAERRTFRLSRVWRRRPGQLSAGDAQRTAIARAMVRVPDVLLLDEPLQLLDPAQQVRLRYELARFQGASGITTMYTTNDHVQVLGLADRIAVLRAGRIVQVDSPGVLLRRPVDRFVAGFVGEPAMTFLEATVVAEGGLGWLAVGGQRVRVPGGLPSALSARAGAVVLLGARPDVVREAQPADPVDQRLSGTAERVERLGHGAHVQVVLPTGRWTAGFPSGSRVGPGDRVEVSVAVRRLTAFDPVDGRAVWHGDG